MKKIIPYILILILLITAGFFSMAPKAEAQSAEMGTCISQPIATLAIPGTIPSVTTTTKANCAGLPMYWGRWVSNTAPPQDQNKTEFKKALDSRSCVINFFDGEFSPIEGCLRELAYFLFFAIPSGILYIVGNLFDTLLALTLSSYLYGDFIKQAWVVVRDLSNIFFIIILLYAAIEMILGIGHGAKKIIGSVIIMALLINFSLFFTRVVVDSTNILALVFYNSIDVASNSNVPPATPAVGSSLTKVTQKSISSNLMGAFDITKVMQPKMFTQQVSVFGYAQETLQDTTSLMITILIIAGAIFLFASYALFISGLSFLGRLVELWLLMIFSPFAFMSYALPILGNIEGIGWKNWLQRLLTTSFMAPIFMFFMYLIAKITQKPFLPKSEDASAFLPMLLLIIIPSMIFIILLMKATDYAKKGSGQLGSAMIGAGKALAGLTVGGAALTAAFAGRKTVGTFMKGASTGDTAASRMVANRAIIASATTGKIDKFKARAELALGEVQTRTPFDQFRKWTGGKINDDQTKVEHGVHARRTLDKESEDKFHKKYNQLTAKERVELSEKIDKNDLAQKRFGKAYKDIPQGDKTAVDTLWTAGIAMGSAMESGKLKADSKHKQGLGSSFMQASRTGTYDARNLANLVAGEYDKTSNKLITGLTSAFAKSFRAGFSTAGMKFGEKPEGVFLKDLGATITEALKSAKINVDLSHVGEEKKEGAKGGGGGHH